MELFGSKEMVLSDIQRGDARAPRVLPLTDPAGRIFGPQFVVRASPTRPAPPRGRAGPSEGRRSGRPGEGVRPSFSLIGTKETVP